MQLSIIIVSYNVRYFLEQCLASLRIATQNLRAEIWVVDNNSSDESIAYLTPLFPEVHFLPKSHNAGFAAANNDALWRCSGQYVLFLNPDTIVAEDALLGPLQYLEDHPNAAALGIRMVDGSGRFLPESKRGFPSAFTSLCKMAGLHKLFPTSRLFARYYLGHLPAHQTTPVEILAGAYMMVRQSVLNKIGGFDEKFFMYGEDIDLSYRITQAGYQNIYYADSTIIHFKGESTSRHSLGYIKVFYGAMQLFVKKHFVGRNAWAFRLILRAGIAIRATTDILRRMMPLKRTNPMPPVISWHAIGWPPHIDKPPAIQSRGVRIPARWDNATSTSSSLLLVLGHSLSIKEGIKKLEQYGTKKTCWLHLAKTNSLVMSSHKTTAGIDAVFDQ
jgi:GT2 family glycosyltransferase